MQRILDFATSKYLIWFLLSLPAVPFFEELISPSRYYPELMQQSGVLSVQILVFTLCITPVTLILRWWKPARPFAVWLLKNRRYFGLAGFAYAVIHTVFYLRYVWDLQLVWLEAVEWPFATGWIALGLLLIVAAVSNGAGVRKLGRHWKTIQRLSYPAIAFALAHWLFLDFFIDDAMAWIVPLLIAKLVHLGLRIAQLYRQKNPAGRLPIGSK